jgi:crotonobetainyl-CoA:carnitine CoA-transferase CaiB-like acyl-CoA transferase
MYHSLLKGLRIIEFGHFISAPYCSKLLADLGAEVIKIEKPVTGDEARRYGPFPGDSPDLERSGLFLWLNSNKQGITLALDTDKGRDVIQELLKTADVFVTNHNQSELGKLGLDFSELKKVHGRLIMASITPFGNFGPYRHYKAYHLNACAAGGVSIGIGDPDREPLTIPFSQGGYQAGANAAGAILAALLSRRKTGSGQQIDISEVEVWGALFVGHHMLTFIYRGVTGIRRGRYAGFFLYPNVCLPCKDGFICLVAAQIEQWRRFLDMIGNPEWAQLPKYKNRRAMQEEYPDEVNALITPWLMERTKEEIFAECLKRRIPCAPVYRLDELISHKHFKAREFFCEIEHPRAGVLSYPGMPYHFSKHSPGPGRPAPLLGQHNQQILGEGLGYSQDDLADMCRRGIL